MAAEEVPEKVQMADAARNQENSTTERMERDLSGRMLDNPGPRSAVTYQFLHPELPVKHHAERGGMDNPCKAQGCGRG